MFFEAETIVFNFFQTTKKNLVIGDMTSRSLIIQNTINKKKKKKPSQNTSYSKMALKQVMVLKDLSHLQGVEDF